MIGSAYTVDLEAHGQTVTIGFDDPSDLIPHRITTGGRFYEQDLLEDVYKRLHGRRGIAVDVGAHIGNHSLWFAAICGLQVVAIEPNVRSHAQLAANVERNPDARIVPVLAAAGATSGRCWVAEGDEGNSGTSSVMLYAEGPTPVYTVDGLVDGGDVVLLKVDVEGAEPAVFAGAQATLERCRPLVYAEAATELERDTLDALLEPFRYRRFGKFGKTPTYGWKVA